MQRKDGKGFDAVVILIVVAVILFVYSMITINAHAQEALFEQRLAKKIIGLSTTYTLNERHIVELIKLAQNADISGYSVYAAEDTTEEEAQEPIIDADARDIIERVCAAEARGEGLEGLCAVAQVIKDRGDLWGRDYVDICLSKAQFAKPYKGEVSDEVKRAVSLVFDEGVRVIDGYATHFYAWKLIDAPSWTENKTLVAEIGCHRFYY